MWALAKEKQTRWIPVGSQLDPSCDTVRSQFSKQSSESRLSHSDILSWLASSQSMKGSLSSLMVGETAKVAQHECCIFKYATMKQHETADRSLCQRKHHKHHTDNFLDAFSSTSWKALSSSSPLTKSSWNFTALTILSILACATMQQTHRQTHTISGPFKPPQELDKQKQPCWKGNPHGTIYDCFNSAWPAASALLPGISYGL